MADWLDVFYDELYDALPEMDMERVQREAVDHAVACADLTIDIPDERPQAVARFFHGYMQQVHEVLESKKMRAQALKDQGRG